MENKDIRETDLAFSDMVYWKWEWKEEGHPPEWSIASDVRFWEKVLDLRPGAKVLDLGCALGYHAVELARRGYHVAGLERSSAFLAEARRRGQDAKVSVRWVDGDMTCMAYRDEFDAVLLWGNTFGMFSDEENRRILRGISQALKPGGKTLIDTQNYKTLPEKTEKGWDFHDDKMDLLMLTEGTVDPLNARFGFRVQAIDLAKGVRHTMPFSWRLYLLPELRQIVQDSGLKLVAIYGDDPKKVDWKSFQRGDPWPYAPEGFVEGAAKRIVLCEA